MQNSYLPKPGFQNCRPKQTHPIRLQDCLWSVALEEINHSLRFSVEDSHQVIKLSATYFGGVVAKGVLVNLEAMARLRMAE